MAQGSDLPDVPAAYPQRTRELSCPNFYLSILVAFPQLPNAALEEKVCTSVLNKALQELHGLVGGAIPYEVLQIGTASEAPAAALALGPDNAGTAATMMVKISKRDLDKVWSACTFMTTYDSQTCRLQVLRASPFLASMAVDGQAFLMALHAQSDDASA